MTDQHAHIDCCCPHSFDMWLYVQVAIRLGGFNAEERLRWNTLGRYLEQRILRTCR